MDYNFSKKDRFSSPNNYMYPEYSNNIFFENYIKNREEALLYLKVSPKIADGISLKICSTEQQLIKIRNIIQNGEISESILNDFEQMLRRFEIAKRLRSNYPFSETTNTAPISTHIIFAEILCELTKVTNDLRYLNTLLKVIDTLISVINEVVNNKLGGRLIDCINFELNITLKIDRQGMLNEK